MGDLMEIKQKYKRVFKALSLLTALFVNSIALANFEPLENFGENPGELTASYLASPIPSDSVVVLLHGCLQNGEQLAKQSGFYALAREHHFNLLIPQQHTTNNIKDCFNWFSPQDTTRDSGELKSIVEMISKVSNDIQTPRIFVVGLSAGGAMATGLLSQYP